MTIVNARLTNGAYGFPRGRARRVRPVALVCIHICGNKRTARMLPPVSGAMAERNYANRSGSNGPSAHDYDARDGTTVRAIDPLRYAAWSNGDVTDPMTSNAGIRRVLALRAKGYNANEGYWLETEEVGEPHDYPITTAQRRSLARRIAAVALAVGWPRSSIDRDSVHGHFMINGVNRQNCPTLRPGHDAFLNDIVRRTRAEYDAQYLAALIASVRGWRKAKPVVAKAYRAKHPIPKSETRTERIARLRAEVAYLKAH